MVDGRGVAFGGNTPSVLALREWTEAVCGVLAGAGSVVNGVEGVD